MIDDDTVLAICDYLHGLSDNGTVCASDIAYVFDVPVEEAALVLALFAIAYWN